MQRRTLTAALCGAAVLAFGLTGCGDKTPEAPKAVTLTVGATPVPHADILKFIEPALKKEGVNLKVVEFSDYVKPIRNSMRTSSSTSPTLIRSRRSGV